MLLENLPKFAGTDRVASIYGTEQMTYRTLWERTRSLAWFLKDNYPSKRPLAIYGDRENDIIVGAFAAILAAKPYVILSDSYPDERVRHILTHCEAELVLSTSKKVFSFDLPAITPAEIDGFVVRCADRAAPTAEYEPDDTALIVYTSGSAGEPKGVEISYRNVETNVAHCSAQLSTPADALGLPAKHLCSTFSYAFAGSFGFFSSFGIFGRIRHVATHEELADAEKLFQYMKRAEPDSFMFTPTLAKKLFSLPEFNSLSLPGLHWAGFGGEALSAELAGELRKRFPDVTICNAYGASESAGTSSGCNVTEELLAMSGYTMPVNDGTYSFLILMDENDAPITEEGRVGELVFHGDMVAKGYYKNSALTRQVFFTLPDGTRAYRTGDLGVLRGGYTYLIGRKDNQVKIGANRVELEDVEAHLLRCTAVRDCAVAVKTDANGVNSLVAYIVPTTEAAAQKRLDVFLQIKDEMMASVERFKIPQKLVFLDELPRNANGKLDRVRLRQMANE